MSTMVGVSPAVRDFDSIKVIFPGMSISKRCICAYTRVSEIMDLQQRGITCLKVGAMILINTNRQTWRENFLSDKKDIGDHQYHQPLSYYIKYPILIEQ